MVDLRTCKKGDILISRHGLKLEYIEPLSEDNYYDHKVKYLDKLLGEGTRTHDGYVFRKNRREEDQDILSIIYFNESTMKVTKEQFQKFVRLQNSGKINMIDIVRGAILIKESEEIYETILWNYTNLELKFT